MENIQSKIEQTNRLNQLKTQLKRLYCDIPIMSINLISPQIIHAIDNNEELNGYSFNQISMVGSTWKEYEKSEIGEGELIPEYVMKMEYNLLYPIKNDKLYLKRIWEESKLPIEEKLQIICPRRRSLLGQVVIDMFNKPDLMNIAEKYLRSINSIDDWVDKVIRERESNLEKEKYTLKKRKY